MGGGGGLRQLGRAGRGPVEGVVLLIKECRVHVGVLDGGQGPNQVEGRQQAAGPRSA